MLAVLQRFLLHSDPGCHEIVVVLVAVGHGAWCWHVAAARGKEE